MSKQYTDNTPDTPNTPLTEIRHSVTPQVDNSPTTVYGYARVSTIGQQIDGNSLSVQRDELLSRGCQEVITDTYTGKTTHRPNLDKLIKKLNKGDTLIVTKLDRLSRSTVEGVTLVETLQERGINVHILNMGMVDNSSMGRLMLTIMLAFAQHEREMILERTQSGKAYARMNNPNYREGRTPIEPKNKEVVMKQHKSGEVTATMAAKLLGVSRGTFYNMLSDGRLA